MKKYMLLFLLVISMCLTGCKSGKNGVEELIQQLDEGKGKIVQITDAQIDTVNEILDEYYPGETYPSEYKPVDYKVTNIENTYLIKGVFGSLKNYSIVLTEKENGESYTLESFYVEDEKVY